MTDEIDSTEALRSFQDSIVSADSSMNNIMLLSQLTRVVDGKEMPSPMQICINAAMSKLLPGEPREVRLKVLGLLCRRVTRTLNSSGEITVAGAIAMRARLYGPNCAKVEKTTQILPDAEAAVLEAYRRVTGKETF